MPVPHVFTIILNWNQLDLTLDCLASLSECDYPNHTIILVDNGSSDGSPERIRAAYPQVVVLPLPHNLGYSAGNNAGLNYALEHGADYLFLLNNDTLVSPDLITRLVTAAQADPAVGMVGPTMFYFEPSDVVWGAKNYILWPQGRTLRQGMNQPAPSNLASEPPCEIDYIDSCAILVKRQVVEKIGLLNEDYFINYDDVDWNTRARAAGYKVIYLPAAHMWHKVSAAMGVASPRTTYYMTRNGLLFFSTHAKGLARCLAVARILSDTLQTVAAWTLFKQYHTPAFRQKRAANLLALRDFFTRRFGKMGPDVERACQTN